MVETIETRGPLGKILMIGVFDVKGSTNIPMLLSLTKYNFEVVPINYRTIIRKYGYVFFANLVLKYINTGEISLVIVCKGNGIGPDLIEAITRQTKTWIYNMDPQITIDMCPEVMDNAKIATFSSCTAYDMAEAWTKMGANCFHMIQGYDEVVFRPRKPVKKYEADISLIGSRTPMRDECKEYLENAGLNVKFYGPGYGMSVLEDDFARVCSSSKYMLSLDSMAGMHKRYFSNRLLRYLGCGACTFHFDPTQTLTDFFDHDKHLVYFTSLPQLMEEMNYLENNPQKRYEIAMNGMDRVLKEFTWDRMMGALIETAIPECMGQVYGAE